MKPLSPRGLSPQRISLHEESLATKNLIYHYHHSHQALFSRIHFYSYGAFTPPTIRETRCTVCPIILLAYFALRVFHFRCRNHMQLLVHLSCQLVRTGFHYPEALEQGLQDTDFAQVSCSRLCTCKTTTLDSPDLLGSDDAVPSHRPE
jgi:hypothetical protein